jgi:hypothetical protein
MKYICKNLNSGSDCNREDVIFAKNHGASYYKTMRITDETQDFICNLCNTQYCGYCTKQEMNECSYHCEYICECTKNVCNMCNNLLCQKCTKFNCNFCDTEICPNCYKYDCVKCGSKLCYMCEWQTCNKCNNLLCPFCINKCPFCNK